MPRPSASTIALALALGLVAVLAWQNRELRQQRDWLADRATLAYHGMYVPAVPVAGLQGESLTLGEADGDFQVLYFFTPQCPYCRESAPMVRALAERVRDGYGGHVQMIGVGIAEPDAVAAHAREHGYVFPVAALEDRRTVMLYRGNGVPLVLVVDGDGRVLHAQHGALDSLDQVGSILAAMRVEAPAAAANTTRSKP